MDMASFRKAILQQVLQPPVHQRLCSSTCFLQPPLAGPSCWQVDPSALGIARADVSLPSGLSRPPMARTSINLTAAVPGSNLIPRHVIIMDAHGKGAPLLSCQPRPGGRPRCPRCRCPCSNRHPLPCADVPGCCCGRDPRCPASGSPGCPVTSPVPLGSVMGGNPARRPQLCGVVWCAERSKQPSGRHPHPRGTKVASLLPPFFRRCASSQRVRPKTPGFT